MPPNQVKISVSLTTAQKLYSLSIIIFMLPTVPFSAEERDQLKELPDKECILIMKHLRSHCVLHVSTYPAVFLHLANRSAWQGKQKNPLPGISGHHLCIRLQLSHYTGRRKCELDLLTIYIIHRVTYSVFIFTTCQLLLFLFPSVWQNWLYGLQANYSLYIFPPFMCTNTYTCGSELSSHLGSGCATYTYI